jgi:hypothetical protein
MSTVLSPSEVRAQLDAAAEELETPEARAAIETAEFAAHRDVREQLVYQYGGRSYYADLALAEERNSGALERLERHGEQMDEVVKYRETRTLEGTEFEYRVNPGLAEGQGGEFAPPTWLNELFSSAPRVSQIVQRLAPAFDLPPGVDSINLPRMTAGTQVKELPNNAAVNERDVATTPVKSPAATFAGMSDWALQSLEQSPVGAHLDWAVFKDLGESLDAEVELSLLTGTGENEQFYGMLNLPETNKVEYTEGVEAAKIITAMGKAIAQTGVKRKKPPEAVLMNTGRFAFLNFSTDTERPQVFTDMVGREFPIASLGGFAVYLDDAIGNGLGVTKEEDTIIACRPSDFVIFYSPVKTSIKTDVLSGTLSARFQLHRYVAAILGRYPTGISYVTGAGMKPAAGWS